MFFRVFAVSGKRSNVWIVDLCLEFYSECFCVSFLMFPCIVCVLYMCHGSHRMAGMWSNTNTSVGEGGERKRGSGGGGGGDGWDGMERWREVLKMVLWPVYSGA